MDSFYKVDMATVGCGENFPWLKAVSEGVGKILQVSKALEQGGGKKFPMVQSSAGTGRKEVMKGYCCG